MKYKCTYTSGGGTEHNDGYWNLKQTPKTTRIEKIEEFMTGVYRMHNIGTKLRIGDKTGNPMTVHDDGTFIVYIGQAGMPYYFEPVDNSLAHVTVLR